MNRFNQIEHAVAQVMRKVPDRSPSQSGFAASVGLLIAKGEPIPSAVARATAIVADVDRGFTPIVPAELYTLAV